MTDQTKRRLAQLGGVLTLAVAAVLIAIALSSDGSKDKADNPVKGGAVAGRAESSSMLAGIPQSGVTLGNPSAKVTVVEFADLQCPYCKEYSLQTLPQIVRDYVRDGKVKIEFRSLSFLGPDSVTAARFAAGAAAQDKLWNFIDVFYFNQQEENTGYATEAFINKIASAVNGLDAAKAHAHADTTGQRALDEADALAQKYGVTGTPTLVVGKTGGELKKVDGFDFGSVKSAIDSALTA